MKNVKKVYMTPSVEVMNARVEKGFAGSGVDDPIGDGRLNGSVMIDRVPTSDFD